MNGSDRSSSREEGWKGRRIGCETLYPSESARPAAFGRSVWSSRGLFSIEFLCTRWGGVPGSAGAGARGPPLEPWLSSCRAVEPPSSLRRAAVKALPVEPVEYLSSTC